MAGVLVNSDETRRKINGWILDNLCHEIWKDFQEKLDVTVASKDYIQGVLYQDYDSVKYNDRVQALLILCRLSDGESYNTHYDDDSEITVLEDCVKLLETLMSLVKSEHHYELLRCILYVKSEAVLVCCRVEDIETASEVFARLFGTSKKGDKVCLKVKEVLKSSSYRRSYFSKWTYKKFLQEVTNCLAPVLNSFKTPVLVSSVKFIERIEQGTCRSFKLSDLAVGVVKPSVAQQNAPDLQALREKILFSSHKADLPSVNLEHGNKAPEKANASMVSSDGFLVPFSPSPKKKKNSAFTYRKNESRPDRHQPSTVDSKQDDDTMSVMSDISMTSSRASRARIKWTEDEARSLFHAVQKFGVGNWAKIRVSLDSVRTNVDLKDKWRNMIKSGLVERFTKENQ